MTSPAVKHTEQEPDFYSCIVCEFDEIREALARMKELETLMLSNFNGRHDVALKLSLEMFAKKAEQARVMSNHLAGIMVRRINRKPRV